MDLLNYFGMLAFVLGGTLVGAFLFVRHSEGELNKSNARVDRALAHPEDLDSFRLVDAETISLFITFKGEKEFSVFGRTAVQLVRLYDRLVVAAPGVKSEISPTYM